MTIHIGSGTAHKQVTDAFVGVGGVYKRVTDMWVGVGGVWKKYYSTAPVGGGGTFSLTGNANVTRAGFGFPFAGDVSSVGAPVGLGYVNGVGPYTYSWSMLSLVIGDAPTISNPSIDSPYWTALGVPDSFPSQSIWRVTVTDTANGHVATFDVTVTLIWHTLS